MRTTSDRAKWRRSFVLVGVAALVGGTLACGGDDGTDTASAGSSTPATSSTYGVIGDSVEETTEPTVAPSEVIVTEVAAPTDRMSDVTLYAPDTDGSWPVTVLFSGWGSSRSVLDSFARTLAAEGVVVATVDSGTPDDILAGEYECSQRLAVLSAWGSGADPAAPVAVGGHSMGAGLALMASVFDPFISMTTGGPLDCGLEGEDALPPVDLVIGLGGAWAPAECDVLPGVEGLIAMVADGFPAYVHPYDGNPFVPIMMAHGTADGACPIEAARAAAEAFEADGHPVELLVFEGGGHSGGMLFLDPGDDPDAPADPDAAEGREVVAAIVRALSPAESEAGPGEAASAATGVDIITDLEATGVG